MHIIYVQNVDKYLLYRTYVRILALVVGRVYFWSGAPAVVSSFIQRLSRVGSSRMTPILECQLLNISLKSDYLLIFKGVYSVLERGTNRI